jgi:hypothetical protein
LRSSNTHKNRRYRDHGKAEQAEAIHQGILLGVVSSARFCLECPGSCRQSASRAFGI